MLWKISFPLPQLLVLRWGWHWRWTRSSLLLFIDIWHLSLKPLIRLCRVQNKEQKDEGDDKCDYELQSMAPKRRPCGLLYAGKRPKKLSNGVIKMGKNEGRTFVPFANATCGVGNHQPQFLVGQFLVLTISSDSHGGLESLFDRNQQYVNFIYSYSTLGSFQGHKRLQSHGNGLDEHQESLPTLIMHSSSRQMPYSTRTLHTCKTDTTETHLGDN